MMDLLKSKKFRALILGIVVTILVELIPGLAELEGSLHEILAVIGAYIVAQGIADHGKERALLSK